MNPKQIKEKIRSLVAKREKQKELLEKTKNPFHLQKIKNINERIRNNIRKLSTLVVSKDVSARGLKFISDWEGFYAKPYNDPAGYATVGYGYLLGYRPVLPADNNAVWVKGQAVRGQLTKQEARRLLASELKYKYEPSVRRLFAPGGPLYGKYTQNRYDALVSFVYNLGPSSLSGITGFETIGKAIKEGNIQKIGDAMLLYDKAGGKALPGLTRRRKAERRLLLSSNYRTDNI